MKVSIQTTKDGSHEVVFPEDFWNNHGFGLRSTFEGRICYELLRIGREAPERAREINEHYTFVCESKLPAEYVPHDITIPHIAKIKPARTLNIKGKDYLVGDGFREESIPIFTHPSGHTSLRPWTRDSDHIYQIMMVQDTKMYQFVPELKEYKDWFGSNVWRDDSLVGHRLQELNGNIVQISQDVELSDFLKKRSKFFVLSSLADAKLHSSEDLRSIYPRCEGVVEDFADIFEPVIEQVYASEELVKKLAANAEALCLEYLNEMQD